MPEILNYNNVPTLTNLVAAGNPRKKATARNNGFSSSHLDELNQRIDEIEDAIGQDNVGPVGRAHAIRAESKQKNKLMQRPKHKKNTQTQ